MQCDPASPWDESAAQALIARRRGLEGGLLPLLQDLQAAFGYVPREAVPLVAEGLNLSRAEVWGVVSFYHDLRETPPGRRVVRLCRGEACQSLGAERLAEAAQKALGLASWGDAPDGRITLEPVYCLGLCATAPAALVDGAPRGRLTVDELLAAMDGGDA